MQGTMKRTGILLLACMAAMLGGCGTTMVQPKTNAVAQGEDFQSGSDSYMLSEIVRLPDYDTQDCVGYGVLILMKSDKAPISFSMNSGNSNTSAQSLVSLSLNGSGEEYTSMDVSFSSNDGGDYKGKALFAFTLPNNAAFPETGTFRYTGNPTQEIALSFIGMEKPEATEEPIESKNTPLTTAEAKETPQTGVSVTTFEELKSAAEDASGTKIDLTGDIDITEDYTLERSDDLEICVGEGITLTISGSFEMVDCTLINNGFMTVSGSFVYGISNFINSNVLSVAGGGIVSCGQSDAVNYGVVTVEEGGVFFIERGTIFENAGTLSNYGLVNVRDGGQLNDQGGAVENNGTIELSSYYNGDITLITGTGTLNDHRE